jgi:hypothetical protein
MPGTSVPGQHEEGVFAFSFIIQVAFLAPVAFNSRPLRLAQGLFNGHRPAALEPQGELVPFDITEWAATAQAASITRTNNAIFRLFKLPEPDEQHSPPEPDGSLHPSLFCVISSFVSILFPQK